MKRMLALIMAAVCIFSFSACGEKKVVDATVDDAKEYLTRLFSSYGEMNNYLKDRDIAISAFALDGAGLSSLLRAVYQAESVIFGFSDPIEISDNVFTSTVTVAAPDIEPLYDMYAIDRQLAEGEIDKDFVAQSFYNNICSGTTQMVTTDVSVTIRVERGRLVLDPSNDLAFAIFPNIDKAN